MSPTVMFCLFFFYASSIGLFHECSSLLKKKKKRFSLFYFTTIFLFFNAFYKSRPFHLQNRSDFFFYIQTNKLFIFIFLKTDLIFLHTNQKPIFLFTKMVLEFFF